MLREGAQPIPGYRLEKFLGRGQFGEVWKTTAPGGTSAALKFIDLSGSAGIKEFRGIQRVKEIRHAHLMPITALWMLDADGNVLEDAILESYEPTVDSLKGTLEARSLIESIRPKWLVVAMLLGELSLQDKLAAYRQQGEAGIPLDELLQYMEEAAKGIDFLNSPCHNLGHGLVSIQHCDIKPANMMLLGNSVLICDFGLARMLSELNASATATSMVGSPAYMAPESIERHPSNATDQYSLAVTYYELRTGEFPFEDMSYLGVLDAHRAGRLVFKAVSPEEQLVLKRATSVQPKDRFPTAVEMVRALRRATAGVIDEPPRRSRSLVVMSILTGLLFIAAGVIVWAAPELVSRLRPPEPAGGSPQVKARPVYAVQFDPPEVKVSSGGIELPVEKGLVTLTFPEDRRTVRLQVSCPGYMSQELVFTERQLADQKDPVRLEPDADYLANLALEQVDANPEEALRLMVRAIAARPALAAAPEPVLTIRLPSRVEVLVVSPDSRWFLAGCANGMVHIHSLTSPEAEAWKDNPHGSGPVSSAVFTPDGKYAFTASDGLDDIATNLVRWNLADRTVETVAGHAEPLRWLRLSSGDPPRLISVGYNVVHGWDLDRLTSRFKLQSAYQIAGVAALGPRLLVASERELVLWETAAGEPQARPLESVPAHPITAVLGLDQSRVLTGDAEGAVRMVQLDQGTARELLPARARGDESAGIQTLRLNPAGDLLAVGDRGGSLQLLKLAGNNPARLLRGHSGEIADADFSPDGRWLVSGSWEALLWDVQQTADRPSSMRFPIPRALIRGLQISADSRWLVAGTFDDSTVRVWRFDHCRLIKAAMDAKP